MPVDGASTSWFVKDDIETSFRKISAKSYESLTLVAENSVDSSFLTSEKSVEPTSRELSSQDRTYAWTLKISNISFESSFLFFKSFFKHSINTLSFDYFLWLMRHIICNWARLTLLLLHEFFLSRWRNFRLKLNLPSRLLSLNETSVIKEHYFT